MKPYPKYRESGVPWLGKVPEHWDVRKLGSLFRIRGSGTTPNGDNYYVGDIPWAMSGDLNDSVLTHTKRSVSPGALSDLKALRLYPAGSLVIAMYGATIGKTSVLSIEACTNQACFVLAEPLPTVNVFFAQNVANISRPFLVEQAYGGGQPNINSEIVQTLRIPLPTLPEQAAILRFLDHIDGRIRRLIRIKQKLIKLLEEQKQAIIHRAVTRGIDPNVRLKPSGVEWLGDVPEHWKVERTKVLFRLRTEKSGTAHGKELLSIYTHIGVRPRKELEEKGNKASTTDDYWVVRKGDLIANKLLAWMGAVGVSHYEGVTSPAYDILKPIVDLESDYFHHLFRTKMYLQQFKQRSRGIMDMRLRLYFDQFGQIPIPVPPVKEQRLIIKNYVDVTTDNDSTITKTQREISLLREYRTRLFADVVTGKVDVREAAARLPDEIDAIEPIDDIDPASDDQESTDDIELALEEAEA